jgi:hypothetical protein
MENKLPAAAGKKQQEKVGNFFQKDSKLPYRILHNIGLIFGITSLRYSLYSMNRLCFYYITEER